MKLFFTGRMRSGKDYVADKLGLIKFGFADPIYALAERYFGTSDKSKPGAREFMQKVGQWGRGVVSDSYPMTPERVAFIEAVKHMAPLPGFTHVDWSTFGQTEDFWVETLLSRPELHNHENVAITNVRFENEMRRLQAEGWQHVHVYADEATLAKRFTRLGEAVPTLVDISEMLAVNFDRFVQCNLDSTEIGSLQLFADAVICTSRDGLHVLRRAGGRDEQFAMRLMTSLAKQVSLKFPETLCCASAMFVPEGSSTPCMVFKPKGETKEPFRPDEQTAADSPTPCHVTGGFMMTAEYYLNVLQDCSRCGMPSVVEHARTFLRNRYADNTVSITEADRRLHAYLTLLANPA